MNKPLAIVASIAGALCALYLMVGLPSFSSGLNFSRCTTTAKETSVSRDLHWRGGESMEVNVPGTVLFRVGPQWQAVAIGPASTIDHLRIRDGKLELDRSLTLCGEDIRVELTGPAVRHWRLSGSGHLALSGLEQDALDISASGSGVVRANGKVQQTRAVLSGSGELNLAGLEQTSLDLNIHGSGTAIANGAVESARVSISGSGNARLGDLNVKDASVQINGSGDVDIAPQDSLKVQVNGSGNVRLLKTPKSMQQQIHGSGSVVSAG